MGCAKSKEAQSQQGKRPFSFRSFHRRTIFRRSFHRGNKGDDPEHAHSQSHRLSNTQNAVPNESFKKNDNNRADGGDKEHNQGKSYSNETRQTYSDETNHKVSPEDPITPTMTSYGKVEDPRTPPTMSEAEVINGRESTKDDIPISPTNFAENNHNFSFQVVTDSSPSNEPIVIERDMEPKPMWLQMASNDSAPSTKTIVSDFDPEIISTFRKALEELSPNCAAILGSPESEAFPSPGHSRLISNDSLGNSTIPSKNDNNSTRGQNKVVLYFTSLRGVRKTYEDCCNVRVILKSMGAKLDERDVSMHYEFRDELRQLLGTEGLLCKLPRVFVNGKYLGGAEEIQRMDDTGELGNVIKGCEMVDESDGGNVCEMCGNVRFVPCEVCSGSCKIYVEEDGIDDGDGDGGFRRCPYCNENGIVRCPTCCSE